MTIKIYEELLQGSDEWFQARCGLLTASEMKLIITPTLQTAKNDKSRAHVYELAAQRVNQYVEPSYISDDMFRGREDELKARDIYSFEYGEVIECGFMTNDKWGVTIGYSPDGLVDDDGLIECKSRRQKFQMEAIANDTVPTEHYLQLQTGLLVSERKWIDYVSYCGGMPMWVKRVHPDAETMEAIVNAALQFESQMRDVLSAYNINIKGLYKTERTIEKEMV